MVTSINTLSYPRTRRRWQTTYWNRATPVWYSSIWESRSTEPITV